jgi:hypothetical protein
MIGSATQGYPQRESVVGAELTRLALIYKGFEGISFWKLEGKRGERCEVGSQFDLF